MAAPLNNQNALGNKGGKKGKSGRHSAYQERADAQFLADFFFKKHTKEEVKQMLNEAGEHSVSDQMLAKALAGNERYTLAVFAKLFPDNLNINADVKAKIISIDE